MGCNGLDFLISGILVISSIIGFREGFVRTAGGLISLVLAIIIAASSYRELAFWIEKDWGLQSILASWLSNKISAISFPTLGLIGNPEMGLADPAQYLAYLMLLAMCFLLLFITIMTIGLIIVFALNEFFKRSALSGINRLLGMIVQVLKFALIMSVVMGITYPALRTGAYMGLDTAGRAYEQIEGSVLAKHFLILYGGLPDALGLNV